jgi:hypothetical protein
MLLQCAAFGFLGRGGGMGRVGGGAEVLLGILGILAGIGSLVALILILVARCMCCTAPPGTGAKGLAVGAAITFILGLVSIVLFFVLMIVGIGVAFGRGGGAEGVMILGSVSGIGALLLLLTAHILFILFLRAVAAHFGNDALASRAIVYLIFSLVLPVLMVVGIIFVQMMMLRGGNEREVMMFMTVAQWVVSLVLLGWYSSLVAQVRDTVAQTRRPLQRDWGD